MRINVKQAIKRGQITVNIPVFIIMFGTMMTLFYFSSIEKIPFYFTPLSFIIGPICAWFYWSYAIVKWKLWAFKNVRNRHELKEKAIRAGLIWSDGSFFNKTEIWTTLQKEQWKTINQKFKQKDIVRDDLSVPNETVIKYSKVLFWLNIIGIIFLISFSYYLYLDEKELSLTIILFILYAIYLIYSSINKTKNKLFIKLNVKGIQTSNTNFIEWDKTEEINIFRDGFGKNTKYFLKFSYKENKEYLEEKINLMDYSSNFEEIEDIIKIYKQRHKNERTNYK